MRTQSVRAFMRETISGMKPVEMDIFADKLAMKGESARFFGQAYNEPMLEYAEKLLEGRRGR